MKFAEAMQIMREVASPELDYNALEYLATMLENSVNVMKYDPEEGKRVIARGLRNAYWRGQDNPE